MSNRPKTKVFVTVALSDLKLSATGLESLNNSNITFGGANATLVTVDKMLTENIEWTKRDEQKLNKLVEVYGISIYINLEA